MKHLLFFLIILLPELSFSHNPTQTYAPAEVELTGRLDIQTFPGPPNYSNIQEGDGIERHFYLRLDSPVDIKPAKQTQGVENPEVELQVKVMQLAIDANDKETWVRLRKAGKNAHLKTRGTLFHRFTGHHHSRVLLNLEHVEVL